MIFNYVLGLDDTDSKELKINSREAVRAIISNENKILMIHTNKGDYKFPGGGANKKESHAQTLKREVCEESGYIVETVKEKLGLILERKQDEFEENSVFQMTSHYYVCEVSDKRTIQQLDDYELDLDFRPVWLTIDKAIENNEEILQSEHKDMNAWVYRETLVLKALKEFHKI